MTSPVTSGPVPVASLRELDRAHVWHPYGPMPGRSDPLVVRSAQGVRLTLDDGRELVDGMSSWWASVHGYRHPALDDAVVRATGSMSHVMFGGLTHDPGVAIAERLVAITPEPLQHVFLADSGSVSIEVAIKMCLQYQRARGRPGPDADDDLARRLPRRHLRRDERVRPRRRDARRSGAAFLPRQVFADRPPIAFDPAYDEHLRAVAEAHAGELAGIVVEPVVQGAGGMRFHDPRHLRTLREIADAHDLRAGVRRDRHRLRAHRRRCSPPTTPGSRRT